MLARLILLISLCAASAAMAQSWPARPVRVIVPFSPGGSADTLGRLAAQKLSDSLKENFVVENRPGAGGVIGSEMVARAAPDGYTFVVSGVASHAVAPSLGKGTPYDPVSDFTHVALFGGPPAVLVVNPSMPAKNLKELIALLKKEPGKHAYGSPGNGTHAHLVAELFKQLAGVDMQHVPYKGASGAIADLMAGHIPIASTTLSTAAGQIHGGKARALAISSAERLPDYADVPTYAELGYRELIATVWFSLSGPPGLPAEIVNRVNAEVRRAMQQPDVRQRLRPEGIEPGNLTPQEFTDFVAQEVRRWAPVVKASGAKAD